jgi:hypothetical protein
MAYRVGMAEFLEKVCKLKKNEEKVAALKANDSKVLRIVLQAAFDPTVKFLLPEGNVPYTPNKLLDQQNVLIHDARKMVYFIEVFYPGLKQVRRETMFIEFLEALDPKDADMMTFIKDKKFPWKGLTVQIVKEALPGLIKDVSEVKA